MPLSTSRAPTQYLTFIVGQAMFAVGTQSVREIVEYGPITALPMSPANIRGVTNLRGAAIPVLDMGMCFAGRLTLENPRTCVVILEVRSAAGSGLVGIIVDAVSEVVEIPLAQIEPPPALQACLSPSFMVGIGKLNERFVMLLDIEQMLGTEDWAALLPLDITTQGVA